jgi:hypothetical protein
LPLILPHPSQFIVNYSSCRILLNSLFNNNPAFILPNLLFANHPAAAFPIHYSLIILTRIFISVIDGGQWQASRAGFFNRG